MCNCENIPGFLGHPKINNNFIFFSSRVCKFTLFCMASTNICINTLIPLSVGFHCARGKVVKGELLCSALGRDHFQAVHQSGINPDRPQLGWPGKVPSGEVKGK